MKDDEFLSYCAAHSDTPSAQFSGSQIQRALRLAGRDQQAALWDGHLDAWHCIDLSDLVREAYARMDLERSKLTV